MTTMMPSTSFTLVPIYYKPGPKVWYHTVIKKNSENSLDAIDEYSNDE